MHPQIIWLWKEFKQFKEEARIDGPLIFIKTDRVKKFCEEVVSRKHALAMLSALFDITSSGEDIGQIARQIDTEAVKYAYRDAIFRKYDDLVNDCLNSDRKSALFVLQTGLRETYKGRIPSLDANFDEMEIEKINRKEAKLFDPSNLFKE